MDRSWIDLHNRSHPDYIRGVKDFLNVALANADNKDAIRCPCANCNNCVKRSPSMVRDHLFIHGMLKNYCVWVHHGEDAECRDSETNVDVDVGEMNTELDDEMDETMNILHDWCNATHVNDMGDDNDEGLGRNTNTFARLFMVADRELYSGSKKVSKLSFVVKLLHLKLVNGWSNKSFDMLLQFLKEILPSDAHVPKSYYESKKIIRDLGMKYEKIDVCKNDCVLFWNELKDAQDCPKCGLPRFYYNDDQGKKIPYKILRYFPVIPRLQRLFMTPSIAEDMR